MRSGRLRHDGDPVLEWCVGDVVGRPDRRGNLYPAKQRPERKIDAAVALMMAFGRAGVRGRPAARHLRVPHRPAVRLTSRPA
jgi:phage terminase large subunit-like protein